MLAPVCQAHKRAYHEHTTGAAAVTVFRPTVAAPGRLLRLGIVLDTRNPADRIREIARMCDGAGIESLWVVDDGGGSVDGGRLEPWSVLNLAATEASGPALGVRSSIRLRSPTRLAATVAALDADSGGRLELTLSDRSGGSLTDLARYASRVRDLLVHDAAVLRLSVDATGAAGAALAARVADDVLISRGKGAAPAAIAADVREACERNGRDPVTMGIALEMPVSIGRTTAEAQARAEVEPLFEEVGQPSDVGLFGTLEQCQERVIEFAHAGVTDLRCILPNSADVHDVIAQLTAMVVGSVEVLAPNAPRSKAPDPPETWGGRAVPR